ncbi:MAG TPA: hypothetical protein PKJ98_16660 [Verrucomicrobiota bacterium]|nr:hypothetical protein [Verrucomicrobiota bacterium]
MLGEALPIDLAELSAGELIEHRRGPQIALALREAAEYVEGNPQGAGAVVDTALETVRQLRSEGPADNGILHTLDGRRFSIEAKPDEPETRFYIGQTPICTPGNLCAVSASVKAGKSAFVQAMLAAAITMHPDAVDTLGVRARNPLGMAMIHFDTEQSPFDHWMQTERALRRARVEKPPAWFASFCVTGLSVSEARAAIDAALERAHREHGGVYAVVIDGVGDLVLDVNDSEECNGYTAHLHAAAIRYNCSIVTVIHINPGSDNGKTRGHLGSQLERKAETNLRLEKVEEITTVWSDKNRRAPITKANGPRFTWSDEAGMHVSTDQEPVKIGRPKDYTPDELVDLLPDTGLSTSAWQSACESELGVSRRSFYRECKALAHAGRVTKSAVTGLWQPIKK